MTRVAVAFPDHFWESCSGNMCMLMCTMTATVPDSMLTTS